MLDFFSIFSKGGIVLWYFQGTADLFTPSVNALIKSVILQERGGNPTFTHEGLTLQYRLDNEFELIFVVAYQRILQLSYIDKFLDDIQLEFRDKYKHVLQQGQIFTKFEFQQNFSNILSSAEDWAKKHDTASRKMRTYEESFKSKKTVASMIESRKDINVKKQLKQQANKQDVKDQIQPKKGAQVAEENPDLDLIEKNKKRLKSMATKPAKKAAEKSTTPKQKKNREWPNGGAGRDLGELDRSKPTEIGNKEMNTTESIKWVKTMEGPLQNIETASSDEEDTEDVENNTLKKEENASKYSSYGMFGMFKGLVGSKSITREDMTSILDKMKDHLIGKNVASDISEKLCNSVASRLEGKVLGTFTGVASTVKTTLNEALLQLLSPRHRIDILRDVLEAKRSKHPYVVVFCGVNGVGKSTNLAKICFWMIENNLRVLVAACDTFRAGAVEQLRTHVRHLNALHPPENHNGQQMVQLYEKGYGKDASGIATEAINFARDTVVDVVLVDTAGRMQDNEPLMKSLSKLIHVNRPNLVLFVGEALVGNEAVDQLVKFNQALADHSTSENPHLIDGIVLTKFDTIDDKVGAAISMTYITGQPIVFVGTGQTYVDLKQLNAKAVVRALMK